MSLPVLTTRSAAGGRLGAAVKRWQLFLRGQDMYRSAADGCFGPLTQDATKLLQRRASREGFSIGVIDGWVGSRTYAYAATQGFELAVPGGNDRGGQNWPPKPDDLRPLGTTGRKREFGDFEFWPADTVRNPDAIRIIDRRGLKLVKVSLPQLIGVRGFPSSGRILMHARVADQLSDLVAAWDAAKLLPLVKGWSGGYAPRYIRGSTTTLSSHSWGSAFDINYMGNQMGRVPALVGETGSLRELVPLAVEHGFYWGGWFSRKDGMHFECCRPQGDK